MSKLLRDVIKGEKVVFGARGEAQFEIIKLQPQKVDRSKSFGAWKDKMWVAADAFDHDVEAEMLKDFWEEDITDPNKKAK